MSHNFDEFKVPVFPNINDKPTEPTSSKAGNGADIINRFNGFIEKIESTLNSLSATLPTSIWLASVPDKDYIQKVDVYYLNISEIELYNSSGIGLSPDQLVKTFIPSDGFALDGMINISSLVTSNGCGCYVFVITDIDNGLYSYLSIRSDFVASPKGAARASDQSILFGVDNFQGINTEIRVQPLLVIQPLGSVQITLYQNSPE